MGNWRTVTITGNCPKEELDALREVCDPGAQYENFHCLSTGNGLFGLGHWPAEKIDVSGNLAERDYDVESVVRALERIHERVAGLRVKVHCGGDWEADDCIATVTCDEQGVRAGPPEIKFIRGASQDEAVGRLMRSLSR